MITTTFAVRAVVERNIIYFRRDLGVLLAGFIEPLFWLAGIGIGLNSIVDDIEVGGELLSYREFVTPGLVAVAAMNGAAFDSTFNFFYKLHYLKIFDAMLATPLSLSNIVSGEVSWSVLRSTLYATVFLLLASLLGLIASPWAILIVPVAALIGFSISAVGIFSTTFIRNWHDFDYLSLAIQLLFLCSGTFFPITVYPAWAQVLVNLTPLYHGVELCRHLAIGSIGLVDLYHLVVLTGVTVGFGLWARNRLERKLLD
jgi:lipooligosaccharide transport system permease protein